MLQRWKRWHLHVSVSLPTNNNNVLIQTGTVEVTTFIKLVKSSGLDSYQDLLLAS